MLKEQKGRAHYDPIDLQSKRPVNDQTKPCPLEVWKAAGV
jgi:hypothetical protein